MLPQLPVLKLQPGTWVFVRNFIIAKCRRMYEPETPTLCRSEPNKACWVLDGRWGCSAVTPSQHVDTSPAGAR